MSILIKDMNMPTSCPCELIGYGYDVYCSFAGGVPRYIKEYDECCQNHTRPSWCPLVEVPPHGRLIDANKLKEEFPHDEDWDYPVNTNNYVVETIDKSPTIIEADMNSFIHIFEEDDEEDGMDSFIRILKD